MEKIYMNASCDAKKIMNGFKYLLYVCVLFVAHNAIAQTTYYSKAAATDFNDVNSWGTATNGTGTSPASISSADNYVIQNGSNMTLTGNASVRTLLITGANSTLIIASNTLTVAIPSQFNSNFTVSTSGTFTISGGSLVVNGNFNLSSGKINQTGGDIIVDGNNGGSTTNSVASGTNIVNFTPASNNDIIMTGGSFTIVDPHTSTTETFSCSIPTAGHSEASGTHTFKFGDGISNDNGGTSGFRYYTWVGTGVFRFRNVDINTGTLGTNRFVHNGTSSSFYNFIVTGNLNIISGEYRNANTSTTSGATYIAGNLTNNGTFTNLGAVFFANATASSSSSLATSPSTNAQTISGSGVFRNLTASPTANFTSLTINNSSAGGVTFSSANTISGVGTGTVSGTLTLTNGVIHTGSNTFTLGITNLSLGTLTYTAGGFGSGSAFARWYSSSGTGTTIAAGTIPSFGSGSFPFVSGNPISGMFARHFHRNTSTFTTAGPFRVTYNDNGNGTTTITTPFTETVTYDRQTNATWTTSVVSPGVLSGTTAQFCIQGEGAFANTTGSVVTLRAGAQFGTAQAGSTHPMGQRAGLTVANQTGVYTLGFASSQAPKQSVASGKWEDPSTWTGGTLPSCSDITFIMPGHTVTVDATTGTANASSTFVSKTSTLLVSGGTLNVGCTAGKNNDSLVNNGTLSVTGGTININGSFDINNGSNFTHSGGNINIDGNDGSTTANSVRNDKPHFGIGTYAAFASGALAFTGGTITIVDPHRSATAPSGATNRSYAFYPSLSASANSVDASTAHTIQFGNGVSTHAGGVATGGFGINTFSGSGRFNFGNLVVNDISNPTASNRIVRAISFAPNCRGNFTITKGRYEMGALAHVFGGNVVINDTLIANATFSFANPTGTSSVADSVPQTVSGTGRIFNNATLASATANFSGIVINNRQGFGGVTFANNFNQVGVQPVNAISATALTFTLGSATTASGVVFTNGVPGTTAGSLTRTAGGWTNGSTYGFAWTTANTGSAFTAGAAVSTTTSQFPFVTSTGLERSAWINRVTPPSAGGVTAITYNEASGSTSGLSVTDASGYIVTQRGNDNWVVSSLGTTPTAATFGLAVSATNIFGAAMSADSTRILQVSSFIGTHQRGTVLPHGQRIGLTLTQLTSGAFYLGANDNEIPNVTLQSGDWNTASTWSKGVPTCTDNAIIQNTHTVTIAGVANSKNVEIQQGGVLTHNAGGALTIGCTNNNSSFSINGGTFNMNAGTLTVNGKVELTSNVNGIFNQSGGDVVVDGNSGTLATSINGHICDMYSHTASTLQLTGGTFTVVDPSAALGAPRHAFKVLPSLGNTGSGPGWTLKLGNGSSTTPGGNNEGFVIEMAGGTATNIFKISNLEINNPGATTALNRIVIPLASRNTVVNNFTLTDGVFRTNGSLYVSNNLINNDTFINNANTVFIADYNNGAVLASGNAQSISGSGYFTNNATYASKTADLTNLTVFNNNATGVTPNMPFAISGTLTMTSGIINTTSTNILRLGTASIAGTLSGTPSATNFINGPFARTFPIRTASGTYTTATNFPVGVGGVYLPIFVDPQVITGPAIFTVNAINSNSGSNGAGVSNLASKQWSIVPDVSANVEGVRVQINDATISSNSNILSAPSLNGTYDATSGSSTRTIGSLVNNSSTTIPFVNNFYTFGDLTPCTAPSDQPSLATTLVSSTRVNIQITPAPSAPTGYLLVRFPSGTAGTPPTNPTNYTIHSSTLGTGTVIGYYTSPNLFVDNTTGLVASSGYDYYAFAYNNTACLGPVYNTSSPAFLSVTTCSATLPSAATWGTVGVGNNVLPIANLTSSGFDLNWVAPATPPADYLVQVSTNSTFTNIVYSQPSGGATMASLSGLNPGTTYFARVYSSDGTCVNTTALAFNHVATLGAAPVSSFSFNFDNGTSVTTTIWPSGVARYRANGPALTSTDVVAQSTTNPASGANSVVLAGVNTYTTQGILVLPEVNNANAGTHRIRFKYSVSSTTNATCDFGYLSNPADPSSFTLLQNYVGSATNTNQEVTFNIPNTVPQNVFFAFRNPGPTASSGNLFLDDIIYESAPVCSSPSLASPASASASVGTLCNSGTTVISATGYNKDSLGFTYQWQSSTDNFASNIINIGTASANYSNYTSPSISSNMSYRLKTTCAGVGDAFSSAVAITVNTPSVTSTTGGSVCGNDSAVLTGVPASGQTLRWYSVSTGGTMLDTGNTFKTPPLSATTNYFVESSIVQTVSNGARTTNTATSGAAAFNYGLVFDANQSFVIDSVTVYPSSLSSGSMQVVLQNSAGTQLLTTTVNVPAGTSTSSPQVAAQIPIGFSVPVGTGYRLLAVSSPSLFRESSIGGFPYTLGSFGSVTNGYISGNSTTYYYFYNWKVTSFCSSSPRTSVTATYVTPPAFSLDRSSDSACIGSATQSATTISVGANNYTTYTWSPSSGVTGNNASGWNFAPTATTKYILTALNATPCKVLDTVDVRVDELPSAVALTQGLSTAKCFSALDSLMISGGTLPITSLNSYTLVSSSSAYTPLSAATSISFPIETDDDISSAIPIGFSFNFAGTNYSNVYVSTNGFVSFNASAGTTAANNLTASATTVRPLIAPLWDDMDLASGGASYKLEGTTPNRVFTVEWNNVEWNWEATGAVVSFQAKLYESTNNVEFLYRSDAIAYNAGSTGGASVGLAGVSTGSGNFISLNNIGAAPTASMTSESSSIGIKPATGQSYLFRAPSANTIWSPTTGLFTNRAMTTAYSGTSVNKVYAKPSATQNYYLTAINGACSVRDSIVDSVKNATSLVTLATSNASGAVEQCTDANGWSYYATAAKPDEWLFGIYKNGNTFTATVDINVDNANKYQKSASSVGANQEHASYIMSRYWNVNPTGTVGTGVKVRFFIDPQDITDLLDERDNDYDVLKNTTNPSTLAVKGGFEWFKTTNTVYNPTNWTGNKHNGAIVKLTEDAVATLNGQTYVELSGITSFSGGSGGSSFGPSNNGLFSSSGTVGLPVTWKDVKATVKEEGNLIQWTTSSEKNTSHFEVEYSYDAKTFFKASNDIKAAINSTTDKSYDFMHLEEYGELVYYRIKQVDLDGKVDYSKAVVAKRTSKLPEFHVSMYPVPLNVQDLTVRIQTVQKTDITITINDLLGRSVYTERVSPQGYATDHKLSLGYLQNGTYHVTIDNGLHKSVQVLVVGK